jgi:hypothetical protein
METLDLNLTYDLDTTRNPTEGHSVDVLLTLYLDDEKVGEASIRHEGKSPCGESVYSELSIEGDIPDWMEPKLRGILRESSESEIREWWDYNGSQWSEPVDEPEDDLQDEPDERHLYAVVRTAFHGGGIKGYAVSEESAGDWVEYLTRGTDCVCGCFGVVAVEGLDDLPENDGQYHDPYSLMK